MSFEDQIYALSETAKQQREHLATEEAVKTAIILRLIQCLEFSPFDPKEVVPEFTADVGIKRGEKVDYAIRIGGDVAILIECKSPQTKLDVQHASQLFRYFTSTEARFAILTNGYDWQVFTDLEQANKMDKRPFLRFNLAEMDTTAVAELSKFRKPFFDVENILKTASNLKYVSALKTLIREELADPSDDFVKHFAGQVHEGRMTASILEQFSGLVKRSVSEVLRDKVNARLSSAIQHNTSPNDDSEAEPEETIDEIETTQEEWDGYRIAVAIAAKSIDPERVVIRDQKSYCGVLIDDNNRRPLIRMHFNSKTVKYLGLFDGDTEDKVSITKVSDIYKYADRIANTAKNYEL